MSSYTWRARWWPTTRAVLEAPQSIVPVCLPDECAGAASSSESGSIRSPSSGNMRCERKNVSLSTRWVPSNIAKPAGEASAGIG